MASLFIKDAETAALANQVAARLGTTKTDAVRRALRSLPEGGAANAKPVGSTAAWLREYRRAHPLPDLTAMQADKAFYDWLSDEEDVPNPWGL